MKKIIALLLVIAVIAGALFIGPYNSLVDLREDVNQSFAQVETVIQRRADLIPNLVNTVKGYADHEQETLTQVTEARSKIQSAASPEELAEANDELSGALSRLMVVVEQYPDLKANQNFIQLQDELAGTENRIAVERKNYNETVQKYNRKVKRFPTNIVAGIFNFDEAQYFEASPGSEEAPEVNFD
ncbi:MAG: LemA family protein [Tissierellia bacterium]|nr:LemA family protein [Tissierellia bacterium]